MDDRDRRVRNRFAGGGDRAADRRGRLLRHGRSRDHRTGGNWHEKSRATTQQNSFLHGFTPPQV